MPHPIIRTPVATATAANQNANKCQENDKACTVERQRHVHWRKGEGGDLEAVKLVCQC